MTRPLPPAPRACERGFTLAELLVSLFLFGLVSSLILAVVDLEMRLDGKTRERDSATDDIVRTQTVLRARMEQMRPVFDPRGSDGAVVFYGGANDVTFDGPGFDSAGPHAIRQIRIRLERDHQLMLYSTFELTGRDPRVPDVTGWDKVRLLDGVDWVRFDYFGIDTFTRREGWQRNWKNRGQLPRLVRMRVGFVDGDARVWPTLIVRPWSNVLPPCPRDKPGIDCGSPT